VPLLYAIPLAIILISALMIQFGARARGQSRLRRQLGSLIDQLRERLPSLRAKAQIQTPDEIASVQGSKP
jgi:hypothetical protein